MALSLASSSDHIGFARSTGSGGEDAVAHGNAGKFLTPSASHLLSECASLLSVRARKVEASLAHTTSSVGTPAARLKACEIASKRCTASLPPTISNVLA